MAAAVVDAGDFAGRGFVLDEEFPGRLVERVGEDLGAGDVEGFAEMLQGNREGEELAEGIPAEVVFLGELLDVLRRGTAGTGLEQPAAVHERDDGKHLRAGAEFEDREQVGEVVAQDVAGDGNGVLAVFEPFEGELGGFRGSENPDVEAAGVVVGEIGLHLADDLRVVRAVFVQPENGGSLRGAGAGDGELHPVADRRVLGLAGAPDVAGFDGMLKQDLARGIDDADGAGAGDFKGLVVRAVFLGGLRHEADVRHGAHGSRVESAVLFAEVDGGLIDAGVAAVRDDGEGVLKLALGVPHLARGADHGGHRGVHDDVARDVEVGDALVGIDHRERRAGGVGGLDVGLDLRLLVGGEGLDLTNQIAEAVPQIHAERGEGGGVFGEEVLEEDLDGVAENDRVGDLHHGGFQVDGEQDVVLFRLGDLLSEELDEGGLVEDGGVDDFAGKERGLFLEDSGRAVRGDKLDFHGGRLGHGEGFLVRVEIIAAHRADAGLGIGGPGTHRVRVFAGVFLDRLGRAAVGITLAEDGIHGAALDLVVAGAGFLLGIGLRVGGEIGDVVALGLELGDGFLELGHGRADVRQFDDVRVRLGGERAEFRQGVGDFLIRSEILRKFGKNAAGQRDVPGFHRDAGWLGERLDDRQKGISRESRRFVGLGVNDGGDLGHDLAG